ncbi:MAG: hypothetical protein EWM73_03241 [Nitrospira sp.]|nr:MAG: hypothetical protein EWM73_03241 [Nitrospira sp.]
MYVFSVLTSEYSRAPGFTGARKIIASFLLGALLTVLHAVPALASTEFSPLSVKKGVLLVASPSLDDPSFRQAVVLVVEHGPEGTVGLILNRSTKVLLSEALPDITVLKKTTYRLFAGGPVEPSRLVLLFRLKEPPADARSVFDGVYVGGTPNGLRGSWKLRCFWGRGESCRQIRLVFLTKIRSYSGQTVSAASRRRGWRG